MSIIVAREVFDNVWDGWGGGSILFCYFHPCYNRPRDTPFCVLTEKQFVTQMRICRNVFASNNAMMELLTLCSCQYIAAIKSAK